MRLQLTNDRSALDHLMEKLDEFIAQAGISDKAGNQLRLCLDELVMNVISYGYPDDAKGEISVEIEERADEVSVVLEDDGRPFNPFEETAAPDLDAGVDERQIGGLGVFFVTASAKEFGYKRENDRNIVNLKLDAR